MLITRGINNSCESLICQRCPYFEGKSPQDALRDLEHLRLENEQLRNVFEIATEAFKEIKEILLPVIKDAMKQRIKELLEDFLTLDVLKPELRIEIKQLMDMGLITNEVVSSVTK